MLRPLCLCQSLLLFLFSSGSFSLTVAHAASSGKGVMIECDVLFDTSTALANPGLPEAIGHPRHAPDTEIYPRDTYLTLCGNVYPAGTWASLDFMNGMPCLPVHLPIGSFSYCKKISPSRSEDSKPETSMAQLRLSIYFTNQEGSFTNSLELEIGTGLTDDLIPEGTADIHRALIGSSGLFQTAAGLIFVRVHSPGQSDLENQAVPLTFFLELQGVAPEDPVIRPLIDCCSTNDVKQTVSHRF